MDFEFTEDQISLRDAVARWVEKGFSFERRHALAKAGGATRAVYGELSDLGLSGVAIAEDHGGLGFGPVEAMVVAEELGRGLVNAPFANAALVAPLLLAAAPAELQKAWLPRMASGQALVVLAHQERAARYRLNHVTTRATQSASGWMLTGAKSLAPAGDEADAFHGLSDAGRRESPCSLPLLKWASRSRQSIACADRHKRSGESSR